MASTRRRSTRRPTDRELQAYVDGELDAARRAEIDDALREDTDIRAAVHRYQSQKRGVQRLYDHVLSERVPESLTKLLKIKARPARPRHH